MLKLFVLFLILVSVTSKPHNVFNIAKSQNPLKFRTRILNKFNKIGNFSQLESDEKREIFLYEQTIVVRDSSQGDDEVRRCEVFEVYKKEEQKKVLSKLKQLLNVDEKIVQMNKMMDLLKDCDSVDDNFVPEPPPPSWPEPDETLTNTTDRENPLLNGIVPGTNWCGFGDIAKNYHDLSGLRNIDRCCRAHDFCPIKVLAKDKAYNLTNNAIYTKSHCQCDEDFYDCLKRDKGWWASIIGNLYFYVAHPDCIKGVPEKAEEGMKFVPATRKW